MTPMPAPTREIRVLIPHRLHRKLRALARKKETDVSALIIEAVRADVDGSRKQNGQGPHSKLSPK